MNSGVSTDIFTFKQILSTVIALIATLCAPKIYFEGSKMYEIWVRPLQCNGFPKCLGKLREKCVFEILRKEKLKCVILTINA